MIQVCWLQDPGLLIAKEIDKNLELTKFIADKVEDRRNKNYITHDVTRDIEDMLKHIV